ncbi:hypothetical protein Tco_1529644 [Tanacetum coccineum]
MKRCIYTYKWHVGLGLHGLVHGPLLTNYVSFQKLLNELTTIIYGSDRHFPRNFIFLTNNPQHQQQFSLSQYGSIQPNQQYSSHYPSQTQFNHSSIPPSHEFQSQMNHQTSIVPQVILQVAYQSPQAPTQLMTESPFVDSGFAILVFSPGDDPIACLNKAMAFLTVVASSRFPDSQKLIL